MRKRYFLSIRSVKMFSATNDARLVFYYTDDRANLSIER